MHRQTIRPITTTSAMAGIAAAPIEETAKGTMPVTRIVPASPITNAPHQLVPRCREVAISAPEPLVTVASSLMCSSPHMCALFFRCSVTVGWCSRTCSRSKGLEIPVELPLGDRQVCGSHLVPLGGHEVVDV